VVLETADKSCLTSIESRTFKSDDAEQDYLSSIMGRSTPDLDDLLEGLTVWAHNVYGSQEIIRAREQFQLETGKVFPDDPMHHSRTAYFFDYFLFERSISQDRVANTLLLASTPYEIFCSSLGDSETLSEPVQRLKWLGDFRHSLFFIERSHSNCLVVKDIISKQKMIVSAKELESFRALKTSQIIQGFLFRFGQHYQLSPGIILHPPVVSKIIKRFVISTQKDVSLSRKSILGKLAYINIRHIRLKHVEPSLTYKSEIDAYLETIRRQD
jgi:hypothetical protein